MSSVASLLQEVMFSTSERCVEAIPLEQSVSFEKNTGALNIALILYLFAEP